MPDTCIGPYHVVRKLGAGGMGEVYLAEDPRLHRKVALKTLSDTALGSREARERLLREARAAARLTHPNIAGIYDVIDETDRPHIVMEYVEGETLAARARRGRLSREQILDIGIQLCDALGAAHAQGIVHRDLKPSNIVLAPDGKVKVLDFGLAKMHEPGAPVVATADSSDAPRIVGTLAYMSPEQLLGSPVDHRGDIYALGVLLFELLTGRRPYESHDYIRRAVSVVTDRPPAPAALDPTISTELSAIVMRALAFEPRDRYQSALDLRRELVRVTDALGERETRSLDVPWQAVGRVIATVRRRDRTARLAALAAVLVLVIGWAVWGVWSDRQPVQAFRERDWALIADFENQTGDRVFDYTVREALVTALQQSRYVNVMPRAQVIDSLRRMRRADLPRVDEATAWEICRRENVKILLAGSILRSGDAFRITVRAIETGRGDLLFAASEQFRRKEEVFDRVDALARTARERLGESVSGIQTSTQPLARVTTGSLESLQLYSRGLDEVARGRLEDGRRLLQTALVADDDFAMAHLRLGRLYTTLGQFGKAIEHFDRAYQLRDRVTEREAHLIAGSHYMAHGAYEKALESRRLLTNLYPDDVEAHHDLATALYEVSDVEGAIGELRRVVTLDPFAARAYPNLVLFLAYANRPGEAVKAYEQAVAKGIDAPFLQWGLGLARLAEGKIGDGRAAFARLAEAGGSYRSLGDLYLAQADILQGKLEEAIGRLEAGIELDRQLETRANEFVRRNLLGRLFLLRGDRNAARRQAAIIMAAEEPHLTAENLYNAGSIYAHAGDIAAARAAAARLSRLAQEKPAAFHHARSDILNGEIALAAGNAQHAIVLLSAASGPSLYETQRSLARAHARRREWASAAAAWQRVLQSRGEILQAGFAADWVLAHLEEARAYRAAGDAGRAAERYNAFLRAWAQAEDTPLRRRAAAEADELGRAAASGVPR